MFDSIRPLIVILGLSVASFWLLAKPVSTVVPYIEFSRWRNIWLILVVTAFLSPDFWVFMAAASMVLLVFGPNRPEQRVIYYLLLLCALPNVSSFIPGLGGISNLFELSYTRLLVLVLLIPLFFNTRQLHSRDLTLFRLPSDRFVYLYILLGSILVFRNNNVTSALREIFIIVIDIYVPYHIISRNIYSLDHFNRAFVALLIAIMPLALIGIFETAKYWRMYNSVIITLTGYATGSASRAGALRALTIFDSPIIFGYVLMIGFGILLYLRPLLNMRKLFYLFAIIIITALLATVSRGPWIGFAVLIIAYLWTGRDKVKNFTLSLVAAIMFIPFLSLTPFWNTFLQLMPFTGTIQANTIHYRERLFENAWIVFQKNPIFGLNTYRETPEMESMRQGQGIIDVVNSYIHIALKSGLVGLSLFLLIFIGLMFSTYITIKRLPVNEIDLIRLGRVLFAILSAIMVTIGTVSSIDYVPIFYWAFAGITAAYVYLAKQTINKTEFSHTKTTIS